MDREFESKPREVGRVYFYLQEDALLFSPPVTLTGIHLFGRYGSAIAPLGDINQDGYLGKCACVCVCTHECVYSFLCLDVFSSPACQTVIVLSPPPHVLTSGHV